MKKDKILFDLDGTIIDSSNGIYKSVNYAMVKMGKKELPEDVLKTFIGPPLLDSFIHTGMSQKEANLAISYYREMYQKEGMFLVTPYDGIEETLKGLSKKKELFVATSKPEYFAIKILENLSFNQYFKGIYGADLEGTRSEKTAVIYYALLMERIETLSKVVMVGDRKHDILGAKEHNLDSIGVLYGFGDEEELQNAGATQIISRPIDLLKIIE